MSKTRLLLGTSDDPHVRPIADLIPLLGRADIVCQHVRLDASASDDINVSTMREKHDRGSSPVIVGGFSLGARIGALLSQKVAIMGFVGLSYPFYRHGEPTERHGLAALALVDVPSLIIQGTRDSHGNQEQIRGERLPAWVRVHWLEDANHRWRSRGLDGQQAHIRDAAETICSFIQHLVSTADV